MPSQFLVIKVFFIFYETTIRTVLAFLQYSLKYRVSLLKNKVLSVKLCGFMKLVKRYVFNKVSNYRLGFVAQLLNRLVSLAFNNSITLVLI